MYPSIGKKNIYNPLVIADDDVKKKFSAYFSDFLNEKMNDESLKQNIVAYVTDLFSRLSTDASLSDIINKYTINLSEKLINDPKLQDNIAQLVIKELKRHDVNKGIDFIVKTRIDKYRSIIIIFIILFLLLFLFSLIHFILLLIKK